MNPDVNICAATWMANGQRVRCVKQLSHGGKHSQYRPKPREQKPWEKDARIEP